MSDQHNRLAWTDDQVRLLIALHAVRLDGLSRLLVRKGLITQAELEASTTNFEPAQIEEVISGLTFPPGCEDAELP